MRDRLAELSAAGVAVWLDDISRARLTSGGLDQLRQDQHVVGVTSNPTIFAKALADNAGAEAASKPGTDDYATQLRDLASRGVGLDEATRMITTYDVRWACDVMRPAFDASAGVDGRISLEVDPRLAHDTEQSVAEAKQLWWLVDRPNLFIKIPATVASLPAITRTLAEGISVNVTLIFGLDRYDQVMDAFMAGLEQARRNGHDLATIGSVASFFVSRVDTEVDQRLDKLGTEEARSLRGKAGVANAQLAYQRYLAAFDTDRWRALAAAGAHPQRPLWASTSTKNPDYRDVMYVEQLIAPGVVNTMPEPTIHAFADHGEVDPDAVTANFGSAQAVLDRLAGIGIDLDDVTATLEREGVEKFAASWQELRNTVRSHLEPESGQ
ncbi:MAG TPA: transaldolase [Micromonosporaceae bacterium]